MTSQRDRFRQRNAELEEVGLSFPFKCVAHLLIRIYKQELRKQFETISDLRTEIKSLQADNLKLYEKVRYMQSYRTDASTSAGYPLSGGSGSGSSALGGAGSGSGGAGLLNGAMRNREDEIGKYKDKYEESMNPFEAFKGRVSALDGTSSTEKCLSEYILTPRAGNSTCYSSFESDGTSRVCLD